MQDSEVIVIDDSESESIVAKISNSTNDVQCIEEIIIEKKSVQKPPEIAFSEDEEFPSAAFFGVDIKHKYMSEPKPVIKSPPKSYIIPPPIPSEIDPPISHKITSPQSKQKISTSKEQIDKKPVIYIDPSLKKSIDLPQMVSGLTARGFLVSETSGQEEDCIYCVLKCDEEISHSACVFVLETYPFLLAILNKNSQEYQNLIHRLEFLRKKYDSLFIISIGVEGVIKRSMTTNNTQFRQLVMQNELMEYQNEILADLDAEIGSQPTAHVLEQTESAFLSQGANNGNKNTNHRNQGRNIANTLQNLAPRKRKNKNETINQVESILKSFGAKCLQTVIERIHFFECEFRVSIIALKDNKKVIEWVSALPKGLIKREKAVKDDELFPDRMIIGNVIKKPKRTGSISEATLIRNLLACQLKEFDGTTEDMCKTIAKKYPSFQALRALLKETTSNEHLFLSTLLYQSNKTRIQENKRQVGPVVSNRIYKFLTSKDPDQFID